MTEAMGLSVPVARGRGRSVLLVLLALLCPSIYLSIAPSNGPTAHATPLKTNSTLKVKGKPSGDDLDSCSSKLHQAAPSPLRLKLLPVHSSSREQVTRQPGSRHEASLAHACLAAKRAARSATRSDRRSMLLQTRHQQDLGHAPRLGFSQAGNASSSSASAPASASLPRREVAAFFTV